MADMLTEVRLLNVPLENDYKHTLYFETKERQEIYMLSKVVKENIPECSYLRKDGVIRYPAHIDTLDNCNYVMYKNAVKSSKWYYAFIVNKEYKNEEMTELTIETDVFQTYLKDYTVKPSFVEREHTIDDIVGRNTLPEGLETGEFICNKLTRDDELRDYVYMVQVTEYTDGTKPLMTNYGGVWVAGGAYVCFHPSDLAGLVELYSNKGKADAIQSVYIAPQEIVQDYVKENTIQFEGFEEPHTYEISLDKPNNIDGYVPRNKKLLTFPYRYILLSNNAGSSNILQYEHFEGTTCDFEVASVPTVGCSIKCAPLHYKGLERMQQEGLMLGKFPTCSWSSDLYTNWLTQNAVNLGIGVASSGLQIASGIGLMATGAGALAGAGTLANGILGIAQSVGQVYQMSFTPNSAEGNTNGGDINASYKMNTFYFHEMSIKTEYARIIDDFFDMFGYKTNRVKVPNVNHRNMYWYTKTIDVNIDGAIPSQHLQKIKDCYNKGITFWRSYSNIGNYKLSDGSAIDNGIRAEAIT